MILLTGASGVVGRELVKRLASPETPVRVMVRDRDRAASIAFPGVDFVNGDFAKPASLRDSLAGVNKLFLLTPSSPDQAAYESDMIDAAAATGIRHIVKLSAVGADPDSPARILRAHAASEIHLQESGIPYTVLRPNTFMQNFLRDRETIIQKGEFYAPMGDGRISLVDVRDVAAVAAEVLEEYGHEDKVYEVTGPESLTYADVAERFTRVLGKPVTFVDVPPESAAEAMLQNGIPQWYVDALLELFAAWKFNSSAAVSNAVSYIGKTDPIHFADFAHDYATQFGYTGRDPVQKAIDVITFDSMTPGG